jgi:hypothetical protein
MAAVENGLSAEFAFKKATPGTVVFEEVVGEYDAPKVTRSLYVPRSSIPELGWTEGKTLRVTVEVVG